MDKNDLTKGKISKVLINKTIPMFFGMLAMISFNLVDTYFVGKLGKTHLASLAMTFPVVFFISSITMGLGMGVTALISRAYGANDTKKIKTILTDSLLLGIVMILIVLPIGLLTIKPLFRLLGANDNMLGMILQYMNIWFWGVFFVIFPMIGNSALRGMGDTKTPMIIMIVSVIANVILDPILIFGYGPFPEMGIRGAALATVLSRATTFVFVLWILIIKKRLISIRGRKLIELFQNIRELLYIGVPSALSKVTYPLSIAIITRIVSPYGEAAIAGYGVGTKLDAFAFILIISLATVISPFIGQNFGARLYDRMKTGLKMTSWFSVIWISFVYIIMFIFAKPIASIFNKDASVILHAENYIKIVGFGFSMQALFMIVASALNTLNKPVHVAILTLIELFVLSVPLALLGSKYYDMNGIYFGLMMAYLLTGIISIISLNKMLPRIIQNHEVSFTKE